MKKIFSLFAVAILGLATVGCADDVVEEQEQVPTVEGVTMLVAQAEEFAIQHGSTTSTATESRTWSADAKVGVYGTKMGNNVEYKLFESYTGAAEGAFYGKEVQGELYVYYPYYEKSTRNGSKVVLPLPETQVYNADFGLQMSGYNPTLVAKVLTGAVTFNYLTGALGVQVQGGATVKKIVVSSESHAMSGAVAVDFAHDFEVSAVDESKHEVTLDCGEGVVTSLDEPTTFYVLVPPATYNDLKVTVTIDGGEFTKNIEGLYTIARLKAVDTDSPTANATIVASFDTLQLGGQSDDSRVWAKNSAFGVFAEGVENTKYVIAPNEAGKSSAIFAGSDIAGDYVAYYPWSNLAAFNEGVLTVYMNTEQTYNADKLVQFAENAPFMYATGTAGEPLEFKYVSGALGLRCKVDGNIKQVTLNSAEDVALSGAVNIDLENGYVATANADSNNRLVLNCGEEGVATTFDNPTTLFVCLPAGTYNNFDVTLSLTDGSIVQTYVKTPVEVKPLEINTSDKDITYTVLDVELEQSSLNCKKTWESGETVSVFDLENSRISTGILFRDMGVGTAKATFTVPSENVAVLYPAQDFANLNLEGTKASFVLPATQTFDPTGAISKTQMPFIGLVNTEVCKLYNVLSLLEVKLTGDMTVNKVVVKSKTKRLAGPVSVNTNYTDAPTLTMSSEGSREITIDCGEGFTLSSTATVINVAIPATTYAEGDLTIDIYTDWGVYSNMPTACTLTRAAATSKSVAVPQPTNLTATDADYANCFLLNSAGWYCFTPKTRGGYDRVANEDIIKENSAAYVLYESSESMFTNAAYIADKNLISFCYDGTAGNGGICVADAPNNISWTWHMWCPGAAVRDVKFGTVTLMDRNIGARAIPGSKMLALKYTDLQYLQAAGMIYQMGRPTPFPGAKVWAKEAWETRMGLDANTISEPFYYPSAEYLDNGKTFSCGVNLTVESAVLGVKNPMHYFVLKNEAAKQYWSDDFQLDTNSDNYPWKMSVEANVQFDPCPAGYFLPTYNEMYTALKSCTWQNVLTIKDSGNNTKPTAMARPDGLISATKYIATGGYRSNYGLFNSTDSESAHFLVATGNVDAEDNTTTYNRAYITIESKNVGGSKWTPANGVYVRCVKR